MTTTPPCSNCGALNPAGAATCGRCESPLESRGKSQPVQRPGSSRGALRLVLPLALVGVGAATWLLLRPSPESAVSVPPLGSLEVSANEDASPPPPSATTALTTDAPAATMAPSGTARVGGELPRELIQATVRSGSAAIKRCYEEGLGRNPTIGGTVRVRFVIAPDGSVPVAIDDGSDMPDERVTACIVHQVQQLVFPQPRGGPVTVTYPFVFSAGGHDEGQH